MSLHPFHRGPWGRPLSPATNKQQGGYAPLFTLPQPNVNPPPPPPLVNFKMTPRK
jgi:hypothetical protein